MWAQPRHQMEQDMSCHDTMHKRTARAPLFNQRTWARRFDRAVPVRRRHERPRAELRSTSSCCARISTWSMTHCSLPSALPSSSMLPSDSGNIYTYYKINIITKQFFFTMPRKDVGVVLLYVLGFTLFCWNNNSHLLFGSMTFVLFPVQIRNWRAFNDGGAKFVAAYDSESHAFSPSLIGSAKAGEILFNGGLLFVLSSIIFMSCFLCVFLCERYSMYKEAPCGRVALWASVCGIL